MSTPINNNNYHTQQSSPSPMRDLSPKVRLISRMALQSPSDSSGSSVSPFRFDASPMPQSPPPRSLAQQLACTLSNNDRLKAKQLAHQVDLREKTDLGDTPLICAGKHGAAQVVEILLERNAPVHETNDDGNTALMESATRNQAEIVRLLCNAGASLDAKSATGRTVMEFENYRFNYRNSKEAELTWNILQKVQISSKKPEILHGQEGIEVERRKMITPEYRRGLTMSIFRKKDTGQVTRILIHPKLARNLYEQGGFKICKFLRRHLPPPLDAALDMVRLVMKVPSQSSANLCREFCQNSLKVLNLLSDCTNIAHIDTALITTNKKGEETINFYQIKYDCDLNHLIEQSNPSILSNEDKLSITGDIVNGVAAMHAAQIAHRDIKPENILIRKTQTGYHAVLHDFDLCMLPEEHNTSKFWGTPYYIPADIQKTLTETGSLSKQILLKADIWALGRTLTQLWEDSQSEVHPLAQPFLDTMLSVNPNKRPDSSMLYHNFLRLRLSFQDQDAELPSFRATLHTPTEERPSLNRDLPSPHSERKTNTLPILPLPNISSSILLPPPLSDAKWTDDLSQEH